MIPLHKTLQIHRLYLEHISTFIGLYNTIKNSICKVKYLIYGEHTKKYFVIHSGNYHAITVLISAILMEGYNCKYNVCPAQTLYDYLAKVPTDD